MTTYSDSLLALAWCQGTPHGFLCFLKVNWLPKAVGPVSPTPGLLINQGSVLGTILIGEGHPIMPPPMAATSWGLAGGLLS